MTCPPILKFSVITTTKPYDCRPDADSFMANLQRERGGKGDARSRFAEESVARAVLPVGKGWISLSPPGRARHGSVEFSLAQSGDGRAMADDLASGYAQRDRSANRIYPDLQESDGVGVIRNAPFCSRARLLCLYGLGTNTGLKRMGTGAPRASITKICFMSVVAGVNKDHLRPARPGKRSAPSFTSEIRASGAKARPPVRRTRRHSAHMIRI